MDRLLDVTSQYGMDKVFLSNSGAEAVENAIKVPLNCGDAILFVDCLAHGSAKRTSPGHRLSLLYRYGPHWGHDRFGFEPSDALLERLTPERRKIIQPIPPKRPPVLA